MSAVDDLGTPLPDSMADPPRRVVSLVPSLTESVEATLPGTIIGATDYCTHPATLTAGRVGGSKYPDLDAVCALRPDLVVANVEENRESDVRALREAGIPVWVTEAAPTVPAGLAAVRRLLTEALGAPAPAWLLAAENAWPDEPPPAPHATAVIPVWRRPWVVLGRDTFAGDLLRRLGVGNVYAGHADRYPRPPLAEVRAAFADGSADLLVLPDEPYLFTADDGPDAFDGVRYALVSGRHLTWCGPSLVEARALLRAALPAASGGG
jgi:ABC-type Fe3+-hydroxamate transport system substrate-binding protein